MTDQPNPDEVSAPAPEVPQPPMPSPGAWLKQAREQAGLSVEQVAKDLYLDTQVIRAIEVDEYARVGAPVYARGYLRRYAKLVGLAETGVLARYDTLQGVPRVVDPIPVAHGLIPAPRKWVPRWVLWLLLILVIVTVVIMVVQSRPDLANTISTSFNATTTETTFANPATTPTPLAQASASTPSTPQPGSVSVQLNFSSDSWVEMYDAAQKAVLYERVAQAQVRRVSGMPPLKVTLGSAQGVQLAVNGQTLVIPADRIQANVAHFVINAAGQIE